MTVNKIVLINPKNNAVLTENEDYLIDIEGNKFPIINKIPRFVDLENYASSFGFQWNFFAKTQLDEKVDLELNKQRLFKTTNWNEGDLSGINILEVGSGAGKFTQVLLKYTKANIYSVDYSTAVEVNFSNNKEDDRLSIFQASIYDLPFPDASFDKVICLGVLQHTPNFEESIRCLTKMLKVGGELIIDFYPIRGWYTKIHAKYILRPILKKIQHKKLLNLITKNIDWMITVSFFFIKLKLNRITNRFIPIVDLTTLSPNMSKSQLRERAILDTFDMFSPQFDNPQKAIKVEKWLTNNKTKITFSGTIDYFSKDIKATVIRCIKL